MRSPSTKKAPFAQDRRAFIGCCARSACGLVGLPAAARWLGGCGDNRPTSYVAAPGASSDPNTHSSAPAAGPPATTPAAGASRLAYSDYPALGSVGGSVAVTVAAHPLAVVRTGPTSATVLSAVCPHQGCTIGLLDGQTQIFTCPCHGSQFDESGALVHGPAPTGLTRYPATADATGITFSLS